MIRGRRLILLLTPLVLIWALTHFFLDRGIARAIERTGAALNGARVDVGGVTTRFWGLSATLHDLQVADPDAPMVNRLQIQTLRLQIASKPLFWYRVIVQHAEITGIRTGTPRRRSGALPRPGKDEKPSVALRQGQELAATAWDHLQDAYNPAALLGTDGLACYARIQTERQRLTGLGDRWTARVDALKTDGLAEEARALTDNVKNASFSGGEGLAKARQLADDARALRDRLRQARRDYADIQNALSAEITQSQDALRAIDRLKKKDVEDALARARAGLSVEGFTRGLLGPTLFARTQQVLVGIQKAQALASTTAPATPPRAPRRGQDIPFPFHYHWPRFHVETASLSGETSDLSYTGTLRDIGTDPALVGRPTVLEITGARGPRELNVLFSLDLSQASPAGHLRVLSLGHPLDGLRLGDLGGPVRLSQGQGTLEFNAGFAGETVDGKIALAADGFRLTLPPASGTLQAAVGRVLSDLRTFSAQIAVTGPLSGPSFHIRSSLDKDLGRATQAALDARARALRQQLEARVNALVDGERARLADQLKKSAGPATQRLNLKDRDLTSIDGTVQKALNDLAARSGGGATPLKNLKKLFTR